MPSRTLLRPMTQDDVPAVLAIVQARGLTATEEGLVRHLKDPEGAGFVVEDAGAVCGAIAVSIHLDYALLGPPLLDPAHDGSSLDLHLVRRAFSTLARRAVMTVDAEAPPALAPLYQALGFRPVGETVLFRGGTLAAAPRSAAVRRASAFDLLDVGEIDAATFGYGRKGLFLDLLEAVPEGAQLARGGDGVEGYLFTTRAPRGWALGPWVVAPGGEGVAAALLDAALTSLPEGEVTMRVPSAATLARTLLHARGFEEVGRLMRLRFGGPRPDVTNPEGELARGTGPIY